MLKLVEWLGVNEAGIKVFEDVDWNDERAATNGLGTVRTLAFCEEIVNEKNGVLSRQTAFLDFFQLPSRTRASRTALLDAGHDDDNRYDPLTIQQDVTLRRLSLLCQFSYFL